MDGRERLREAVAGLGSTDAEVQAVVARDAARWLVRYEDLDIAVELVDDPAGVLFTVELQVPQASRKLEIYEALLTYNLLLRDTGGVVMAIGDGGAIVQTALLPIDTWSPERLRDVLQNLLAKARVWNGLIVQRGGQERPDDMWDGELLLRV